MTTNTLAAIRERADAYRELSYKRQQVTPLDDGYDKIEHEYHAALYATAYDAFALLDIADALTERVRTLEAALRPFAEQWRGYIEVDPEYTRLVGEFPFVDYLLDNVDENAMADRYQRAYEIAADALAANADDGNGGA